MPDWGNAASIQRYIEEMERKNAEQLSALRMWRQGERTADVRPTRDQRMDSPYAQQMTPGARGEGRGATPSIYAEQIRQRHAEQQQRAGLTPLGNEADWMAARRDRQAPQTLVRERQPVVQLPQQQVSGPVGQSGLGGAAPISSSLVVGTVGSGLNGQYGQGWRAPQQQAAQQQPAQPQPAQPAQRQQVQGMGGGSAWDRWVGDAVEWWRNSAAGQAAQQRWEKIVDPQSSPDYVAASSLPSFRTPEGWQQYGLMMAGMGTTSDAASGWLAEQAENKDQPAWFRSVAKVAAPVVDAGATIPQLLPFDYIPAMVPLLGAAWAKYTGEYEKTPIGKQVLLGGGALVTGLQAVDDTVKIAPLPGKPEYTVGQFMSSLGRATWENPWLLVDGIFLGGRQLHDAKMKWMAAYDKASGGPGSAANGGQKQWSLLNVYSDPRSVQATYDDLMMVENKAGMIAGLTQQAQQAQASGDALKAAELGAEIEWWKNARPVDVVDKHTELLPELAFTMLLDWTNVIGFGFDLLKLGPQTRRMAGAMKAATADEATVLRSLDEAVQSVQAAKMANGESLLGTAKAGAASSFVGLTNEARANQQAADLFTFFAQLLGDVRSVDDARVLVQMAAQRPQELITGLRGLTGMADVLQADGTYRVGAGVFNTRVIEAVPTLMEARETLLNLPSLNAESWNVMEGLAEIHDALFASAFRVHGLADWAMPQGTRSVRAVDVTPGPLGKPQMAIEYLDEQENVISRSAVMGQAEAMGEVNKLERWIADGRTQDPAYTALRAPDRLVRGFISSAFLNLMPGHWVRNAVSGMGHLATDGVMTFEKTDNAIGYIANQFGGVLPLGWMRDAFQRAPGAEGATASAQAMGAPAKGSFWDFLGKGNLLSRADAAGSEIWTGGGDIAGRVPSGEMNMRLRGFIVPFRRGLQEEWGKVVTRQLGPMLDGLGVDGKTKGRLIGAVVDAAVYGNKREVVPAVRRFLDGTASAVDMQALGLANGSISPEAYRAIRQVLDVYMTNGDRAAAERAINEALDAEQLLFARILADTPAQPGRQTFTQLEGVQDFGELLRDVEHAARRAGADPAEAARPVQELITQFGGSEENGYAALMQLAAEQPTPQVRALLFDTWAQVYDAKIAARQRQGALARAAMEDPALWMAYPQQITEVWREFFTTQERLFQEAMGLMGEAQAGRYVSSAPAGSHGLLEKLASIDTDAAMRQMGQVPRGLADPEYQAIIDAGRSFQDQAASTMYTVALRYGEDVNAFDHVISAEIDVRRMSAAAAAAKAEIAAKYPDLRKASVRRQYYKEMSELWNDFWWATSGRYHAASMEITGEFVQRRLAPDSTFVEPWADPFGRTLTLLEPVDGEGGRRWRVFDMDTQRVADDLVPENQIPPEAIAAWEQQMGGAKVRQQAAEMVRQVHEEGRTARGGAGEMGRPATMPPPDAGARPGTMPGRPGTMPDPWSGATPEQLVEFAQQGGRRLEELQGELQLLQSRLQQLEEEAEAITELVALRSAEPDIPARGGAGPEQGDLREYLRRRGGGGGAPQPEPSGPPQPGGQGPSVRGLLAGPVAGEGPKLLPAPRDVAPSGPVQGTAADSSLLVRLQQRLTDIEQEKAFYRELLLDVYSQAGPRGEVRFQGAPGAIPTKEEIGKIGRVGKGETAAASVDVVDEGGQAAGSGRLTRPESMRAGFAPGDQVQLPNGKVATVKSATATSVSVEVQTKAGKTQTKRYKVENVTLVERAAPPAATVEEGMRLAAEVDLQSAKAGDWISGDEVVAGASLTLEQARKLQRTEGADRSRLVKTGSGRYAVVRQATSEDIRLRQIDAENSAATRQDVRATKDYDVDRAARRAFVDRYQYRGTANSLQLGDMAQVVKDVQRGRLSAADALVMAEDAHGQKLISAGKLDELRSLLAAEGTPTAVSDAPVSGGWVYPQDEVMRINDQIRSLQRQVDRLQAKAEKGYSGGARPPAISSELAQSDARRMTALENQIAELTKRRTEIETPPAASAAPAVKAGDSVTLPDGETGTVIEVAAVKGRDVAIVETAAEEVRVAPVESVESGRGGAGEIAAGASGPDAAGLREQIVAFLRENPKATDRDIRYAVGRQYQYDYMTPQENPVMRELLAMRDEGLLKVNDVQASWQEPRFELVEAAAPAAGGSVVDEAALRAELKQLQEQRETQYWAFTRQARGKPVDAAITRRIGEIERQLGMAPPEPWRIPFEQAKRHYHMNETAHRLQVEKAVKRGETVPDEVLAEYPDLAGGAARVDVMDGGGRAADSAPDLRTSEGLTTAIRDAFGVSEEQAGAVAGAAAAPAAAARPAAPWAMTKQEAQAYIDGIAKAADEYATGAVTVGDSGQTIRNLESQLTLEQGKLDKLRRLFEAAQMPDGQLIGQLRRQEDKVNALRSQLSERSTGRNDAVTSQREAYLRYWKENYPQFVQTIDGVESLDIGPYTHGWSKAVRDAVAQGQPIPPSVLDDYERVNAASVAAGGPNRALSSATSVPAAPGVVGRGTQGWSDPTRKYEMQYEVVELDDLVASNTADGRINPQYPAELQPRDRSQAASQLQVRQIAGNLAPEELLSETNAIDRGAPIVGAGNAVESGNGRTMALRSLDDAGYAPYRAMLLERAGQFGIDAAAVEGMRRPVLVRRRLTEVDPVQFAAEANARTTLGMNMAEQSGVVAGAIRAADLQQLQMGAADTLRQALSMQQNQEFVRRVLAQVPANERAALVDATGMLTTQGVDTIRAALFNKVFANNPEILRNYIQAPKPELANVGNGLERAVGMLAYVAEANPDLAIGDDLAVAASMLMELRRTGTPVETRLSQLGMFEQISEEAKEILVYLDANARSGRKIGDMLSRYAESALLYDPNQMGMFAQAAPDKVAMLQTAMRRADEGGQSMGLFDSPMGIALRPGVPLELRALWAKLRRAQEAGPGIGAAEQRPRYNFGGVRDVWPASLWEMMGRNDRRVGMAGNLRQPTIGDVAAFRVEDVDQLRRRLLNELDALTAAPLTLTNQQKMQVLGAVQQLMPQYDNVLAGVTKGAQAISDFAMLDYGKVHGFDTAIALHTPFHFWFTRSAKNWAERSLLKPSVLASYLRIKRAIDQQNERENTPQRMSGTIGIPGTEIRIANPYNLLIPYQTLYELNDYGESTPNPNAVQRFVETAKVLGFGMNPLYDSMYKVAQGRQREIQAGDFVPQYRLINYLYKAMTGNELPSAGDEYDPYRDARTIARMVQGGAIDANTARWLQDRLYQKMSGAQPLPEEAAQEKAIWDRLTQEAAQASGLERLIPLLSRSLTGLSAYQLPQGEQDIRGMQAERRGLGYGPENAFGSQAAVDAYDAQSGYEGVQGAWMGKDAVTPPDLGGQTPVPPTYPYQQPYTPTRPGLAAVDAQKKQAKAAIQAEMDAAVEAGLAANPNMKPAELKAIKAPFYDRLDELDLQYPSATNWAEQGPRDFYGNMNPQELLQSAQQSIVYRALDELAGMKPGEGASAAQWDAYNAALERRVGELMGDPAALSGEVYGRPVEVRGGEGEIGRGAPEIGGLNGLGGLGGQAPYNTGVASTATTGGGFTPGVNLPEVQPGQSSAARALIDSVLGANTTAAEGAYWDRRDAQFAANEATWAQRKAQVYSVFGEAVGRTYEEYLSLPSGSQARKDYKAQHPELRAVSLLAYHPQEYGQLAEMFGADGVMAWAKLPPASDRKARSAYYDENPKAFLVQAWVYGRPGKQDEQDTAADEAFSYNFGADYATAEEMFGADIWNVVGGYKRGWDKATKSAYYRQNGQLSPFFDWWYGNLDDQPSVSPYANVGRAWSGGGGGGARWRPRPQPVRMPDVWAREMDRSLWNTDTGRYGGYEAPRTDLSWLRAGDRLAPEAPRKWRRERLW